MYDVVVRADNLGILPYREAWQRQEAAHAEVLAGGEERIFYVEHPHTLTVGRRAELGRSHILADEGELERMHVEVVDSDRGGDVTYHGPGQLVAYPIIRLADRRMSVGSYMCALQKAVIDAIGEFHVVGNLSDGFPGVWCQDSSIDDLAKVCAVGVRVRRGVTMHGLALNVEPDLSKYHLIDACGLGKAVTSLKHLRHDDAPSMAAVRTVLHVKLCGRLSS